MKLLRESATGWHSSLTNEGFSWLHSFDLFAALAYEVIFVEARPEEKCPEARGVIVVRWDG